ncbi:glucagon receptor-like, partial [Notothenia coriiceps]|uniref:Glucagon receptor-like n=1 Tax=Notothenia coriiceps TaxID=8208 RepID=A0A6I9Q782_9TELE
SKYFTHCQLCTRKLRCMRNNIHMNLFASFILRAVSILVKDALLTLTLDPRSGGDTRTQAWVNIPAVTWCRGAMVMMQYSVMANNYWLLVEGIYLHSLLVITVFSERKYFYIYLAIGWVSSMTEILKLHFVFQGLLVAILYCFINKEVQSEMLKNWKRWKLGKDIDEEYRHTHSHTPHLKSGSIATGNPPYLHDNNASDPGGDSPRLNKAEPSCSAAPEENRRLVVSYSNGMGKGGTAKSRHTLQFSFLPHRGASSHVSTATEEACLEEKLHTNTVEGEETNV